MSQVIPKHMATIREKFGQLRSHRCRGCSADSQDISLNFKCLYYGEPQIEKDLDSWGHTDAECAIQIFPGFSKLLNWTHIGTIRQLWPTRVTIRDSQGHMDGASGMGGHSTRLSVSR